MNITVEKQPECIANVSVVVPAEKVTTERNNIIKAFTKQANIKGFRPGKAPKSVIEKRYADDIDGELESRLINEACNEAIKQEELKALHVKTPEQVTHEDDGTFTFSTSVILAPTFELPEYKGLEVEAPSAEVTDEDVNNTLEDLRQRFADFNDVERELGDDDFAVIDFTATLDGKPVADAIGKPAGFLEGREGHWVKVEEDSFLPGFGPELKGLKIDDTKEVTITIGEDFPLSDVRGADVTFNVTVKGIKEQVLPEINDEFAGKLLPEKGLDELKEVITEQLTTEKERAAADAKVNSIVEQLNEAVDFELPQEVLESEVAGNRNQMIQRGVQQGMSPEQIEEQKEEIEESAKTQARTNLKTNFILQEIAFKEEIEVSDQDMIQRVAAMAQQENVPVKKYIKDLQKNNAIQNVRNSVLIGKTIDFLVENAKVTEAETTVTEEANA